MGFDIGVLLGLNLGPPGYAACPVELGAAPSKEAKLCFMGHALMENRNGLIVGAVATRVSGHAERLAALRLIAPHADLRT